MKLTDTASLRRTKQPSLRYFFFLIRMTIQSETMERRKQNDFP